MSVLLSANIKMIKSEKIFFVHSFKTPERLFIPHFCVSGVDGLQDWGVNYSPSYVCALKGSTVTISCTLTYPQSYTLEEGFWTKPVVTDGESPDLCSDPEKRGRVQCLSEYRNTHRITLMNVTEADKHIYYCRMTDYQDKRWTVIPGSWLDVTGKTNLLKKNNKC